MNLRKRLLSMFVAGSLAFGSAPAIADDKYVYDPIVADDRCVVDKVAGVESTYDLIVVDAETVDTRRNEDIDWLHYDKADYLEIEVKGFSKDYSLENKTGCKWTHEVDTEGKGRGSRTVQTYHPNGDLLEIIDRENDGWVVALSEDSFKSRKNPEMFVDVILVSGTKDGVPYTRSLVSGIGGGDEAVGVYDRATTLYNACATPIAGIVNGELEANAELLR